MGRHIWRRRLRPNVPLVVMCVLLPVLLRLLLLLQLQGTQMLLLLILLPWCALQPCNMRPYCTRCS
jgi:hypothetical protein